MGPADELEVVEVVELVDHLGAEQPAGPAGAHFPVEDVVGVAPHHVAEGAIVGYFYLTINQSDLIDGGDVGGEPAVDAKH